MFQVLYLPEKGPSGSKRCKKYDEARAFTLNILHEAFYNLVPAIDHNMISRPGIGPELKYTAEAEV